VASPTIHRATSTRPLAAAAFIGVWSRLVRAKTRLVGAWLPGAPEAWLETDGNRGAGDNGDDDDDDDDEGDDCDEEEKDARYVRPGGSMGAGEATALPKVTCP
jgi:hypothetical protein